MSGLTNFQADAARLFFSLPASDGFLLAGGGALLASGLTTRPTEDLDFFGERGRSDVTIARQQFEAAAIARGWVVDQLQVSDSFARVPASWPGFAPLETRKQILEQQIHPAFAGA